MNLIEKIDAVQRRIARYPDRMDKIKNPGDLTGSLRQKLNSDNIKFEMKVFLQELRAASVPLRLALVSYTQIKKDIVSDIEEIDDLTVQANEELSPQKAESLALSRVQALQMKAIVETNIATCRSQIEAISEAEEQIKSAQRNWSDLALDTLLNALNT
ncbi:hypothetical protein IJV57_04905 [Candidatus Saccharibacteria bacterium]|nr:hypothetical protein [Candidatus Saccharibacteria bacterium]